VSVLTPRRFWTLVSGLPREGAFTAHLLANDRTQHEATGQEPPRWRAYFGRSPLWELTADLYDLTHQIAAGKKHIPSYPRDPAVKPRVLEIDELTDDMWR
jgi:hypothetical protein